MEHTFLVVTRLTRHCNLYSRINLPRPGIYFTRTALADKPRKPSFTALSSIKSGIG